MSLPATVSTRSLIGLPIIVICLMLWVHLFGNVHDQLTPILLLLMFGFVLASLALVPVALLAAHRAWSHVPGQKNPTNLAKIVTGWLYVVGVLVLIATEVAGS
jgi:hypothetical protein